MKKQFVGGLPRNKKTSKLMLALQKDQDSRREDRDEAADASVCSSPYSVSSSKNSCTSLRSTSGPSLSDATSSLGGRHPAAHAAFSNRQVGLSARHFDVLLPPSSSPPSASEFGAPTDPNEESFLEGLLVMAPDSKEMLDDLLHPDPFRCL